VGPRTVLDAVVKRKIWSLYLLSKSYAAYIQNRKLMNHDQELDNVTTFLVTHHT